MNVNFFFQVKKCLFFVIAGILLGSCASTHEVVYFQNAKNSDTIVNTGTFTPRFKVNDILSIYISTFDKEAASPFNLMKGSGSYGSSELDYLVDKDGEIDFPILGKLKLLGLTGEEGKALIVEKLKDYLKNPIVNIRIKNFRITILGEVNRPGTYNISGERITILEALGLAGDLKIKGKRNNVLVIRNFKGAKTYTRVDLTTKEVMRSPVYYLTQNDVVYVEPNKSAIVSSSLDNRATIAISIASVLITSTVILLTRL